MLQINKPRVPLSDDDLGDRVIEKLQQDALLATTQALSALKALESCIYEEQTQRIFSDSYDHGDELKTLKARISVALQPVMLNRDWYKYPYRPEVKAAHDAGIAIIRELVK